MGLILDTSIIVASERGLFDLDAFLVASGDESVAIAAITASELLHGVERARDAMRERRRSMVEGVLNAFPVIPFGLHEARIHARVWALLAGKGRMMGAHDLQVAATCLAIGSAVATLNAKEFKRVAGLNLAHVAPFAST